MWMQMPVAHQQLLYPSRTSSLLPKPCIYGNRHATFLVPSRSSFTKKNTKGRVGCKPSKIKGAIATGPVKSSTKVKANVNVLEQSEKQRNDGSTVDISPKRLSLELVISELDPATKEERSLKAREVRKVDNVQYEAEFVQYEAEFEEVSPDYGEVGAVYVTNEHDKEIFVEEIVLKGFPSQDVILTCKSWVQSKQKRIFFTNKSTYLPSKTPSGLEKLRKEELESLRGDGKGERKRGDRIYDYDVYNDLADTNSTDTRPVLGGKEHPYPRRCRTGRPPAPKDPSKETRSNDYIYVPRDEEFSEIKQASFAKNKNMEMLHSGIPAVQSMFSAEARFEHFADIEVLFNEGINLKETKGLFDWFKKLLGQVKREMLKFKTPEVMKRDRFSWLRDEEFARQTLAGVNPSSIQLVTLTEWPLRSKLDPKIYGPQESAITAKTIEEEIKGFKTVEEAIEQKKLFILDYHDILLPYVAKVRKLKNTTLYGSRTLFFLTPEQTLKPLAIELTRPPMDGKPQWKQVFKPTWNSIDVWLWRLAKANVIAHDSGYHQLIAHWLRTHCATEPYIIAANRELSAMHPIYRLLHPHFRYTMEINAEARKVLINVDGMIEKTFSTGKYSMELSSVIYDKQWRFDHQGLPKDLINRGMAIEDTSSLSGLKLAIEDYPYANDGLELWGILKEWVKAYVSHYYPDASLIQSDPELQAWWDEVRTVGHGDKKDESWWPKLKTPEDLVEIITTIVWVTSGHHAAVNFGQYDYAGYIPNRPTTTRQNMPTEDKQDWKWKSFLENPGEILLDTFPSKYQAVIVMSAMKILSDHSPDEEYLGHKIEPVWAEDPVIKNAFDTFHERIMDLGRTIDRRNADESLFNRHGAGVLPYKLLIPFSEEGVTGKGVPCSISI